MVAALPKKLDGITRSDFTAAQLTRLAISMKL
jgi:hypothetical protein